MTQALTDVMVTSLQLISNLMYILFAQDRHSNPLNSCDFFFFFEVPFTLGFFICLKTRCDNTVQLFIRVFLNLFCDY